MLLRPLQTNVPLKNAASVSHWMCTWPSCCRFNACFAGMLVQVIPGHGATCPTNAAAKENGMFDVLRAHSKTGHAPTPSKYVSVRFGLRVPDGMGDWLHTPV